MVDEQDSFSVSSIKDDKYVVDQEKFASSVLFAGEFSLISSVNGFYNGAGELDYTTNPLGAYILKLAKIIFNGSVMGMRVASMLFSVGCLVMLYAIGLKLFKEGFYAFLIAFLYAFSGYSVAYGTIVNVNTIVAFFVLCAFYFALSFSKSNIADKTDRKPFISILLAGLFTAVSLAVKSQALFFLPAIVAPVVYALCVNAKTEQGKGTTGFGVAISLISFILLPVLVLTGVYGLGAKMYMTEQATLVFDYGFAHFAKALSTGVGASAGYIINLGVETLGIGKVALANFVVTFVAILATIYLVYAVITLLVKGDKTKKYLLPRTFIFLAIGYLGSYIISLFFAGNPGVFATTLIFGMILTATAFRHLDKINKKTLFNVGNVAINLTRLGIAVLFVTVLVAFIIGLPIYLGI